MSMLWIAILALSAPPAEGTSPAVTPTSPAAAEAPQAAPRCGRELDEAAHAALRRWARASDKDAKAAAREFIVLYKELQQDTRLARSQRDSLRTTIRGRLLMLAQQIAKRDSQGAEKAASASGPKSVRVDKNTAVLGQMGGGGQQALGGGGGGMGQAANDDVGEDLVSLIQQTVAPKTWEANGGPGTISYWRTQRVIVAHTTEEVHEQIADLLDQLERAGH